MCNKFKTRFSIVMTAVITLLSVVLSAQAAPLKQTATPSPVIDSFSLTGRVWHDLDASQDSALTAEDNLFSDVIIRLASVDNEIKYGGATILTIPDDSPFSLNEDGEIVDQSGNTIDMVGNIIDADGQTIGNIFGENNDIPYNIDEHGLIFYMDPFYPLGSLFHGGFTVIGETITDLDGYYFFDVYGEGFPIGEYAVAVDVGSLPTEKVNIPMRLAAYETDGILDQFQYITLTETDFEFSDINFSYVAADFGDLPDSFSTTGADAPFHTIVSNGTQIMLGDIVTIEPDGQPDLHAQQDIDEGVLTPSRAFEAGKTEVFEVVVSGNVPSEDAIIGMWTDWNHDGQFSDEEFLRFAVLGGVNIFAVTAPDDYVRDALAVRFRLFSTDHLPGGSLDWEDYQGGAINGEVEDYVIYGYPGELEPTPNPLFTHDFGDLPESYSTMGEGAPSHELVSDEEQIMMGDTITSEANGQPDPTALGDIDEGIPYDIRSADSTATFDVAVSGNVSAGGAPLGVWIDWDHNGEFNENEFLSFNVAEGINLLSINIPDDFESGALGMRFRLFAPDSVPGGTLDWEDYKGVAVNGEVEDYIYYLLPSAVSTTNQHLTTHTPPLLTILALLSITLLLTVWMKRRPQ